MKLGNGALSMMSFRISTKRSPAMTGGKRLQPTTFLSDVPCTSLLPVSPEVATRFPAKTPTELLQAFVPGDYDVKEGDLLVHSGKEYPIREAAQWALGTKGVTLLVLEEAKV